MAEFKIPTADSIYEEVFEGLNIEDNEDLIPKLMIGFAKLHCIEQAKVIIEKVKVEQMPYFEAVDNFQGVDIWEPGCSVPSYMAVVNEDSILNAYSLDLIK
jgi:hypothetical protein